ncbi:hypothetical protein [Dongia sp. agr-C8]
MAYEACIREIQGAAGGKLTEDDLADILDEILKRKNRRARQSMSQTDYVLKVAEEYGRSLEEAEEILKRNAYQNAQKRIARRGVQAAAPDPALGMEAALVGVNTPFGGSRDSVEAVERALTADWLGGFHIDAKRAGLHKYAASGMDDRDIARELAELNKTDGKPGITGNKRAASLAAILDKYQSAAMATMNRSGAWVKPLYGRVSRTMHDPDKIRGLGRWDLLSGRMPAEPEARAAWSQFVLDHADLDKTFGGRDGALKALPTMWAEFTAGQHLSGIDPDEVKPFIAGANQGRRASSSRTIVWKSAEDWAAYNAKYGAGSTTAAVLSNLKRSAKISALMQKFGTNPLNAFESDLAHWKQETILNERKRQALTKAEPKLRNLLAIVDGSADIPANAVSAARVSAWMRWQRWAKLGSAPLSAINDLASKLSELRYQGVPFLDRYRGLLTDYLGRAGMVTEQREAADLLRAGVDGEIHNLVSRYEVGMDRPGLGTTIDNAFFKYTGLTPMTDNQRLGAQMIMARHIGRLKGKTFAEMPRGLRVVLEGVGIGNSEWDLLRSAEWKEIGKRDFFDPSIVDRIDPQKLAIYAGSRGVENAKAELRQKVLTYIHDRGIYAVLEAGSRVRQTLLGASRPGTAGGNALRLLFQFKAFPAAMLEKTWGREIYGGGSGMDRLAGISELMIASTILGYVSMSLRDVLYGKTPADPRDPQVIARAIVAGGGLSIYGDFIFGSWSRYGASAGDSLLGPTFGQLSAGADLVSALRGGQDGWADAFKIVKQNIPGQNIWLTRTLLDHLLVFPIQEALNPGYLKRLEKRQKNQAKEPWLLRTRQSYWLPPTSAVQ